MKEKEIPRKPTLTATKYGIFFFTFFLNVTVWMIVTINMYYISNTDDKKWFAKTTSLHSVSAYLKHSESEETERIAIAGLPVTLLLWTLQKVNEPKPGGCPILSEITGGGNETIPIVTNTFCAEDKTATGWPCLRQQAARVSSSGCGAPVQAACAGGARGENACAEKARGRKLRAASYRHWQRDQLWALKSISRKRPALGLESHSFSVISRWLGSRSETSGTHTYGRRRAVGEWWWGVDAEAMAYPTTASMPAAGSSHCEFNV